MVQSGDSKYLIPVTHILYDNMIQYKKSAILE